MGSDHGFAVLYRLRLKGRSGPERIAAAVGFEKASVETALKTLSVAGHTIHREGRISGWLLTPSGRSECERLIGEHRNGFDQEVLDELYDTRFLPVNKRFKALCARWQTAPSGDASSSLKEIHRDIGELVQRFGTHLGWFPTAYAARLDGAFGRFEGGDPKALLQPFTDSYHDVWMELHEDLLLALGRSRKEED